MGKKTLEEIISLLLFDMVQSSGQETEIAMHPGSELASALELFLPSVLRKSYIEWEKESLDGIFLLESRIRRPRRVEMFGVAIVISDQSLTPFEADLTFGASPPFVSGSLNLGELGTGRLKISGPKCNSNEATVFKGRLLARRKCIEWVYRQQLGHGATTKQ